MYSGKDRRKLQFDRNGLVWWLVGIASAGVILWLMRAAGLISITEI